MNRSSRAVWLLSIALVAATGTKASGQGIIAPGAGPINLSMGGASTAAPIDFGSSYWNPATISGLDRQEFLLGSQLLLPSIHMSAGLPAGSVNGTLPYQTRYGTTRSDSGVASNLATGVAFRLSEDSPLTFGLGVFGLIGGGVNYPGSLTTPVLTPRRPGIFYGVGPIYSNTSLLAIMPTASYQITDHLALAAGPVISTGTVSLDPAFFAPGPKDATGLPTFPSATHSRPFWGGGFQLGLLYELNDNWNLGFSYKSPIWQERWGYNSATPGLAPRRIGIQSQIPAIYSWGVAYKGIENLLIDVDMRYFDYANTDLYGQKITDGGLGWKSIFAVATGVQYQATERMTIRGGYLYNQNPINSTATLFNVQVPGFLQHTLSLGSSLRITDDIVLSLTYTHAFRNAIEGPILQIPGASVRTDAQVDSIVAGLNIQFGGKRNRHPEITPPAQVAYRDDAAPPQ